MHRSRASSQHSIRSFHSNQSNRSINFRTITRDRSTHKIAEVPKNNNPISNDVPTEDQLQQVLKLSRGSQRKILVPRKSTLSQRKLYPHRQSSLSQRKMPQSCEGWKSPPKDVTTQRPKQSVMRHQQEIISSSDIANVSRLSNSSSRSPRRGVFSRWLNNSQQLDLETIDKRLNDVVAKKLQLFKEHLSGKQNQNRPLFAMKSVALDSELKGLLLKLTKIKDNGTPNQAEQLILTRKIECIQTLLAESTIESELMKKYVQGLQANSKKIKCIQNQAGNTLTTDAIKIFSFFEKQQKGRPKKERSPKKLRSLDSSTTNKNSFKIPNPQAYDIYRHKINNPEMNLQPLPRSSYKRDYLILKSEPIEQFITEDNSKTIFPKFLIDFSSNYTKDFKQFKTEPINHKQLDACKDKLKFLQISYMPRRRTEIVASGSDKKKKQNNQMTHSLPKTVKSLTKSNETQSRFSKKMMISEARKQFVWGAQMDKSRIKHKNLKDLQYRLKNIFKS